MSPRGARLLGHAIEMSHECHNFSSFPDWYLMFPEGSTVVRSLERVFAFAHAGPLAPDSPVEHGRRYVAVPHWVMMRTFGKFLVLSLAPADRRTWARLGPFEFLLQARCWERILAALLGAQLFVRTYANIREFETALKEVSLSIRATPTSRLTGISGTPLTICGSDLGCCLSRNPNAHDQAELHFLSLISVWGLYDTNQDLPLSAISFLCRLFGPDSTGVVHPHSLRDVGYGTEAALALRAGVGLANDDRLPTSDLLLAERLPPLLWSVLLRFPDCYGPHEGWTPRTAPRDFDCRVRLLFGSLDDRSLVERTRLHLVQDVARLVGTFLNYAIRHPARWAGGSAGRRPLPGRPSVPGTLP